jgi:hypothetical protein
MDFHNPGNHLKRIDKVWMFVSVDDEGEGIVAYPMANMGSVPLVAADEARLKDLKILAKRMSKNYGIRIRLIELSTRTEVETYG